MQKFIQNHIANIEHVLKTEKGDYDWSSFGSTNRTFIGFFQEERIAHLLVTLFFGMIFFATVITELLLLQIGTDIFIIQGLLVIIGITLLLLLFYIRHYFFLENSIQKLYVLEREIEKRAR